MTITISTKQKIAAGILMASVVLSTASIAFAEDRGGRDDRNEIKQIRASSTLEIRGERDEIKNIRASTTAAIKAVHVETKIAVKAKLDAKKQEKVLKVLRNHIAEELKHIAQLSKRANELSIITLRIKAAGRNTLTADGLLIDARAKLAHASSTLASINVTASSTVSSTTPGAKLEQFKTQFDSVKADIKVVHTDLAEAISSLKGIGRGIDFGKHGTSTTATTTTTVTATTTATTTSSTQ